MIEELKDDPKVELKDEDAVVVVFFASWCLDCRTSEAFEEKISEEFKEKVQFYRLDAANLEAIADRYDVERYPTYVFFRKGKQVRGALVEPMSEGEVRNWLEIQLGKRR
jgi:thioredoxin 1